MYKVYFLEKSVIFDNNDLNYSGIESLSVNSQCEIVKDKAKLLQKLQNTKQLCFICDNIEQVFEEFCSQFRKIDAGGGFVTNENRDILMIFRNRRWDLPKGKREVGEDIELCAVREVMEECGIDKPHNVEFLCKSFHIYIQDGEWILKTTYWYNMFVSGRKKLIPQTEEDISIAQWVPASKLDKYLKTTYASIVEVFRNAGYYVSE